MRSAPRGAPRARRQTPVARHALRSDFADGRPITIVDLAALDGHGLAQPGLDRAPEPGELWVSPALADTMRSLPDDLLADRFDAAVTGTIDAASLAHPDELLAIVGHATDSPTMSRERAGVVGRTCRRPRSPRGRPRPTTPR